MEGYRTTETLSYYLRRRRVLVLAVKQENATTAAYAATLPLYMIP